MRIGVVSDSHNNLYYLDKAISMMDRVDMIVHAGDGCRDLLKVNVKYNYKLEYVSGNNDLFADAPREKVIIIEGKRIFITHGDKYRVNFGLEGLYFKACEEGADMVIYGHVHVQSLDSSSGILFLNPGSVSRPRDARPGYAIIDIDAKGIDIELFTLKI